MWTCGKCGTKVDPSFEVCWNCGTTIDGVEDPTFVSADEVSEGSPLDIDQPAGDLPLAATDVDRLVDCYEALDLMQARFLADELSAAGMPAVSDTHDMHDELGSMSSRPYVRVFARDLPRAQAWLAEYERTTRDEPGNP